MSFEWDEDKRLVNLEKHEIDFNRAILLFDGRDVIETPSTHPTEERW
jgi:uncharacterized DUF497 family protein